MTVSIDDFLDGYELPVQEVAVVQRAGLIAEHARIEAEIAGHHSTGSLGGPPSELLDRLRDLEAEIERSALVVRLRALGTRQWSDLLAEHPPKKDQAQLGAQWNPETWEPAAVAACAVEPTITDEQATRMRDAIPPGEWRALVLAVLELHGERVVPPKSLLLSALALASGDSSTTPPIVESPEGGSLAGDGER